MADKIRVISKHPVCPPLAAAVARANLPEWARKDIKTMEQLEQAVAV